MVKIIAVWYFTMIYLTRSIKVLELVRIIIPYLKNGDPQCKGYQDKNQYDYSIGTQYLFNVINAYHIKNLLAVYSFLRHFLTRNRLLW